MGEPSLRFRPVTRESVEEYEAIFTSRGAPHYCWCMVWRRSTEESRHHTPADRKRQMMKRIAAGNPIGLIAYDGRTAVGWVSVAPRETYRNLGGPAVVPGEVIWSIACFYVPSKLRGQGMVRRLIAGAVAHAREQGATVVEAYPVDADAPSYGFMGRVQTFLSAGFADCGMAGVRRHVMRLTL
jgi:ribosomal protein S18 acetylase RimI-like enzyme